ncbi:MAG: beta strand repeat-containing protein, partial [Thermoanaerobaculia bacterium]
PGGVTDPTPGNNSATDSDTLAAQADLAITKTDGVTTATAGGSVTYTITASNAGPSDATGVTVGDTFPASLTCTWTCVGAGGGTCTASGSGNLNDTVNLPSGGSVTYTASCTVSASATGTLSNTATVAAPGGVTDPTPGNNSATDSDTLAAQADLAITKTDGVTTATAGGSVTYTITASNSGPSDATGVTVGDTFPASLTCTWTCVGAGGGTCTASGSGNINDTVNLPSGGSVTYTASCTISASATGSLSNTATVAAPGGVTDPNPANNSATDIDGLGATADLAITKTDGVTTATPGGSVTYTITASNAGPSNAPGSTVTDTFPASLTCTWTCVGAGGGTCTASGSGNLNDTVNLPAGGSVTYTASCTISSAASGLLTNTATVTAPGSVTDPNPGNNSATDSDTFAPQADLGVTKTDGVTTVTAGGSLTYTIVVSNAGPSDASGGGIVTDTFPASLTCTWTCAGAGGGICLPSGSGNINDAVNVPSGGSLTYTASCTVSASATGTISNTATASISTGPPDPNPANNSATDTDTVTAAAGATVSGTKSVSGSFQPGGAVTYTIVLSNTGAGAQADNPGNELTDVLPASLTLVSASATSGTAVATVGTNTVTWNGSIPAGGSVTITIQATVSAGATQGTTVSNQASFSYDTDGNGTNETSGVTDNPATAGGADPTTFTVGQAPAPIPTLDEVGLLLLALLLAMGGAVMLRRRRA